MRETILILALLLFGMPALSDEAPYTLNPEAKSAIGLGIAAVRFDTKLKFTDKATDRDIFIDSEGTLGLPEIATVNVLYGQHWFNKKHSMGFSYFAVKRETDILSFDKDFDDVLLVNGGASLSDNTRFYNIFYGYSLFQDPRSKIRLLAGINALDLRYTFEAEGELIINGVSESGTIEEEANVLAPLPLLGLDFDYAFTPRWALTTQVKLVGGSYQDVSASVLQTKIDARYSLTRNFGLILGLTYFDADVDIEDSDELIEVNYGYDGAYLGAHFMF
jgi:hypothetical protein